MIGNFIGDFVKGKDFERFENEIKQGILLHREIDRFTDAHAVVKRSKRRLQPRYHHYAPVIVDIYYDHFLSANWNNYAKSDLLTYTKDFYDLTEQFMTTIPSKAIHMLKYMKSGNWLYNYQYIEGIEQALKGMSTRTKFESGMEHGGQDLRKNYELFQEEFELFFPDLINHSHEVLNTLQ